MKLGVAEVVIYALVDPRDQLVRYVGKAGDPWLRLRHHLAPSQLSSRTRKNSWLKALIAVGLRPELRVIEVVTKEYADESERFWIAFYGQVLTNGTAGGDGGYPSMATRARLSVSAKADRARHPTQTRGSCKPAEWLVCDSEGRWRLVQNLRAFSRYYHLHSLPWNLRWYGWQAWRAQVGMHVPMEIVA